MTYKNLSLITLLCTVSIVTLCADMATTNDKETALVTVDTPDSQPTKLTKRQKAKARIAKKKQKKAEKKASKPKPCTRKQAKRERLKERRKNPPQKAMKDMNYEELKYAKEYALRNGDKERALKYAHKMVPLCDNMTELSDLNLEIANLYFDLGKLDKAQAMYLEYTKLYPGTEKVQEAAYKEVLCSFYATLDLERDQTRTVDTIELAESFLKHADFHEYAPDVEKIKNTCRERLFDSEIDKVLFYANRGRFKSAAKRLETIRAEFLTVQPDREMRILEVEYEMAQLQNNPVLIEEKRLALATKFPEHSTKIIAQNEKAKHRPALKRF